MQDVSELIMEVQRITDINDMVNRVPLLLINTESFLNKFLRLEEMETKHTFITDEDGAADLPDGLIEIRMVFEGEKELQKVSPREISVRQTGWAIRAGEFVSSRVDKELTMYYYKELPSLNEHSDNFLLTNEPEVYTMALAFKALADDGQFDRAEQYGSYARGLVDALNDQDEMKRLSRSFVRVDAR